MSKLTTREIAHIMRRAEAGEIKPGILRALAEEIEDGNVLGERIVEDPEKRIEALKELSQSLQNRGAFKAGDIVRWKARLKNKRRPKYEELAIVIEVLGEPVYDEETKDASSSYFREPLDLALGLVDDDGELIVYHFDSRRFECYPGN